MTPAWWMCWWAGAASTVPIAILRAWQPILLRLRRSPLVTLAVRTRRLNRS